MGYNYSICISKGSMRCKEPAKLCSATLIGKTLQAIDCNLSLLNCPKISKLDLCRQSHRVSGHYDKILWQLHVHENFAQRCMPVSELWQVWPLQSCYFLLPHHLQWTIWHHNYCMVPERFLTRSSLSCVSGPGVTLLPVAVVAPPYKAALLPSCILNNSKHWAKSCPVKSPALYLTKRHQIEVNHGQV